MLIISNDFHATITTFLTIHVVFWATKTQRLRRSEQLQSRGFISGINATLSLLSTFLEPGTARKMELVV